MQSIPIPGFPDVGTVPGLPAQAISSFPLTGINPDIKIIVWEILVCVLVLLVIVFLLKTNKKQ